MILVLFLGSQTCQTNDRSFLSLLGVLGGVVIGGQEISDASFAAATLWSIQRKHSVCAVGRNEIIYKQPLVLLVWWWLERRATRRRQEEEEVNSKAGGTTRCDGWRKYERSLG